MVCFLPDSSAAHGAKTVCNVRPVLLIHFCINVLFIGPQLQPHTHLFLHKNTIRRNKTLPELSSSDTSGPAHTVGTIGRFLIFFIRTSRYSGFQCKFSRFNVMDCFEKHLYHLSLLSRTHKSALSADSHVLVSNTFKQPNSLFF